MILKLNCNCWHMESAPAHTRLQTAVESAEWRRTLHFACSNSSRIAKKKQQQQTNKIHRSHRNCVRFAVRRCVASIFLFADFCPWTALNRKDTRKTQRRPNLKITLCGILKSKIWVNFRFSNFGMTFATEFDDNLRVFAYTPQNIRRWHRAADTKTEKANEKWWHPIWY